MPPARPHTVAPIPPAEVAALAGRLGLAPAARPTTAAGGVAPVVPAAPSPRPHPTPPAPWGLDALAGRVVALSGRGACGLLTAAASLVLEAQRRGEPAAWVAVGPSTPYPPDLVRTGVDPAAMPLVRAPGVIDAVRSADWLIRSGGFGVVVVDLAGPEDGHPDGRRRPPAVPTAALSRLAGLARRHRTALVYLVPAGDGRGSIGPFVSLRARVSLRRVAFDRFEWEVVGLDDKHRGPGWRHAAVHRGPEGWH